MGKGKVGIQTQRKVKKIREMTKMSSLFDEGFIIEVFLSNEANIKVSSASVICSQKPST